MSEPERRYWDSSVFIAWIKGEQGRVNTCEAIVQMARRGDCLLLTSAITLAEVVRPRHKGTIQMTEAEDQKIVRFFANPFIRFIDISAALAAQSRQIQWRFGLHLRDALHVVCAIASKATILETYDPDFLKVDPSVLQGCPPIREPKTQDLPLFEQPGLKEGPAGPEGKEKP